MSEIGNAELQRYARHLALPEVGWDGQRRLGNTRVLCVGAGGLGSPLLLYLAAAGIGRIGVVDFDSVELSNLQRQVLYRTADVGRPKAVAAREAVQGLNPHVEVDLHEVRLTSANALEIVRPYDIVVDGTDNFPTRYLTNDACVLLGKPNVYGSVHRFEGQASVFGPHLGAPCYRCLYPEPPPPGVAPSCAEGGVLGVLPGLIGCLQATEVIKLALGVGQSLTGRLLLVEALTMRFREIKVRRDPACPLCGEQPTLTKLIDYEQFCGVTPVSPAGDDGLEVTVHELRRALETPDSGVRVLDVRDPDEARIARIQGTRLLPLAVLPERFRELDPTLTYYVHCKSGLRSQKAVAFLRAHGFTAVKSVRGGILAWADEIDRTVPKY
ncbi:MAG: molybdopterin-synthase adenylyltransferase MoeB [Limisphaerales bacterium]